MFGKEKKETEKQQQQSAQEQQAAQARQAELKRFDEEIKQARLISDPAQKILEFKKIEDEAYTILKSQDQEIHQQIFDAINKKQGRLSGAAKAGAAITGLAATAGLIVGAAIIAGPLGLVGASAISGLIAGTGVMAIGSEDDKEERLHERFAKQKQHDAYEERYRSAHSQISQTLENNLAAVDASPLRNKILQDKGLRNIFTGAVNEANRLAKLGITKQEAEKYIPLRLPGPGE